MTSKNKTIGILVFVAVAITTTLLLLNYKKDDDFDDYDWIMW
jgi:hypothetical protein